MDASTLRRIRNHSGPVIVHVGPGFRFPGVHGGRAIHPGELHVCIEPDPEQYGLIRDMAESFGTIRHQVLVIPRSAQDSAFPELRADEIHIHNLFTQPDLLPQAGQILALAARWLKPGGRILIGHTFASNRTPPHVIKSLACRHGLGFRLLVEDPSDAPAFPGMRAVTPPPEHRDLLEAHMGAEPTEKVHAGYFLAELRKKK